MAAIGYVVIEYNQASRWPALEHETLYDTAAEAQDQADRAAADTKAVGRRETYAVAEVTILELFAQEAKT